MSLSKHWKIRTKKTNKNTMPIMLYFSRSIASWKENLFICWRRRRMRKVSMSNWRRNMRRILKILKKLSIKSISWTIGYWNWMKNCLWSNKRARLMKRILRSYRVICKYWKWKSWRRSTRKNNYPTAWKLRMSPNLNWIRCWKIRISK